jgi:uncharacterized protein YrrD
MDNKEMSLREEIVLILQLYKRQIHHSAYRTPTEEIISIFEKRIVDDIPARHDSETVEQVNYTNGWNHALRTVREMLK